MKQIILTVLIIMCGFVNACKEIDRSKNEYSEYVVENLMFNISDPIILEDLNSIEVKQVIKLDFDVEVPLGQIDKLILIEDRIFVLDRTFSRYLYIYDREGNLLYKIGGRGSGPGEYFSGPKDFCIDESSHEIVVFESESQKILTYSWNGELINVRMLQKTWPYSFAKLDSIFYFAYKTVDKDSYLLRIEGEKETPFLKYKKLKKQREVVADNCFFVTPEYVYFVEDHNNDVVVLKNKSIEKILSFDFGSNSISKDFLSKYKGNEFIKKALSNEKATNISQIVETDHIFAFQFMFKKMKFQIIQDKRNGNYLSGIVLNSGFFPSDVYTSYNNDLVSVLSAEYIDVLLTTKESSPEDWERIINSSHPIISEILLKSREGQTTDYIFVYDIYIN
jgi:hypothetical protein